MADTLRKDFFVSYTSIDRAWAEWIAWALEEAGYSTIIQAWDFRPGTNFVHSMDEALTQADRLLVVLSPDYLTSRYTRPEWYVTFAKDSLGEEGLLLPVRVRECDPKALLKQIVHINLVGLSKSDAKAELLAGVLVGRAKPETEPHFPPDPKPEPRFPGALPPVCNLELRRNPNLIGRTILMENLHSALNSGEPAALTQALRGLGGVGKTQLALEYAYQHMGDYGLLWWISTEETTTLADAYAALARALQLPEAEIRDPRVVLNAVRGWLDRHGNWLLIFDNVTKPEDIEDYLPRGQTGHVIVTSRYQDWLGKARELVVEVFEREESVRFLERRTGQVDEGVADALADALGDLPLALAQAAAYIASTGITLAEYLALFEARRAALWGEESAPEAYPEPVATAWDLSMNALAEEVPAAAELLRLMAFLAPEPVARDWLIEGAEHLPEGLRELVTNQLAWNRGLAAFRRYGLVEVAEAGLLVHRLVQAVTRDQLTVADRQLWGGAAVQVMQATYPRDGYRPNNISVWVKCAALLSHGVVTADHAEELTVAPEETSELLDGVRGYLRSQGRFAEATSLAERALHIGEEALGSAHPTMATRLSNLTGLYRDQGRLEEAEPLYMRALQIGEEALGSAHPTVATSLNNLANLYQDQGRLEEAEPLYMRALCIGEEALGSNHPTVATRLNNLAELYRDQGRFEEAEPLYMRALHIDEGMLGSNHPAIATDLINLATLYQAQGRYEKAEPLYLQALSICEETLGSSHPTVATSLNNLAGLYQDQGCFEEAEPLYLRALSICEETLGSNHPTVATSLNNLAGLYRSQGRYEEAEPLYLRCLAIFEVALGQDHPSTQTVRRNYADFRQQRAVARWPL